MKSLSPEQSSWCGRAVKTPLFPQRGCVRLVQMDAPVSPLRQDNVVITPGCSCPLSLVYRLRYRTDMAQHANPVELHDFFFITYALEFFLFFFTPFRSAQAGSLGMREDRKWGKRSHSSVCYMTTHQPIVPSQTHAGGP